MPAYVEYPIAFCVFGLLFTAAERLWPTRRIDYRTVLKDDIGALFVYGLVFLPISVHVTNQLLPSNVIVVGALLDLPLPVRVVLYYVVGDLGLYAVHRLMHSPYAWRIHRWHHSPRHLYWLAGIRATVPNQVLFTLPFALVSPLLHHAPTWLLLLEFAEAFFHNNWMHTNITWRSRWLELVFVTPRYHHVHHSSAPEHHCANLGSYFTVWDRLFGTYVDPETAGDLVFGLVDAPSPLRVAVGI